MNFPEAIQTCFKKYMHSSGEGARASRTEYWYWQLFMLPMLFGARLLDTYIFHLPVGDMQKIHPLTLGVLIVLALPTVSVTNRRFHDLNRGGWWILIGVIPFVGIVLWLGWFCFRGTKGPNDYGADPL